MIEGKPAFNRWIATLHQQMFTVEAKLIVDKQKGNRYHFVLSTWGAGVIHQYAHIFEERPAYPECFRLIGAFQTMNYEQLTLALEDGKVLKVTGSRSNYPRMRAEEVVFTLLLTGM